MSKCDIKTSAEAWNNGLEAFKKAFKQTGGKTTESIRFAIDEINRQNPDVDFEISSFTNPLIASLKQKGIVGSSYTFGGGKEKVSGLQKEIERAAEKMSTMSQDQKKKFAREVFSKFEKDGALTDAGVKNLYADAIGIPATNEALSEQIASLAKARQEAADVESQINEKIKEMQGAKDANNGKLTPEQNKAYTDTFASLAERRKIANAESMKQASKFANMLQEKKFWLHQLTDYMPLNLMNPNSLLKNVSGAVADGFIRTISNAISSPVSQAVSVFTKVNSSPMGARARGIAKANIKSKAAAAWRYGVTEFDNELPRANYLDAYGRMKRAMDDVGLNKWKGILSGILKIHPALISKGLTVPDAMVYEMVKSAEMYRIAEAKGLKGAELEAFMLRPDEKSEEVAGNLAKKATFKQELPFWMKGISKLSSYDPHEATKKMIAAGISPMAAKIRTGVRAIIQKTAVPFIKTPINIVRTSSSILLPEYEFAESMIKAYKETDPIEKQRLYIEGTVKATVGFMVRFIALQLIAKGLMSSGYGDEEKKTKDIVEQELGGTNRVNYSALIRGLTFQSMDKKKNDTYIDLSSLGALGVCLAVYAHAYSKFDEEDIKERTQYNRDLLNTISVPWDLTGAIASSAIDFTFFTGINQLQKAVKNDEGYEKDEFATSLIANIFTGIVPSTAQKLSMQASPEVKKQFDKDKDFWGFHGNLANVLGYRFAFQSKDLQNKYFSLAEPGQGALKKKRSMLFDNYLGRVLEAEFDFAKVTGSKGDDNPISRLYKASRQVPKKERENLFPPAISDEISIQTRRGGKQKSTRVQLTEKQHAYLQEQASSYRMMLATPFIMSKDFQTASPDDRAKVLQNYYRDGLKNAKQDLKANNPDILSQKTGNEDPGKVKKLTKKYKVKKKR